MIEMLSIDLTNHCSKACDFCYNRSHRLGATEWATEEVIAFSKDCISHGVKAISFGGGEPLEYPGIFNIIEAIKKIAFVSVTSNGLPLLDEDLFLKLKQNSPDKIHITIHYPDNAKEVERVINQIIRIKEDTQIIPGVNLLVSKSKVDFCRNVYQQLKNHLEPKAIILVPQRFRDTPVPSDLAVITAGEPFQSPSCLLRCSHTGSFASVSWDKKVNWCSFAGGKEPLQDTTYAALIEALSTVRFTSCKQ